MIKFTFFAIMVFLFPMPAVAKLGDITLSTTMNGVPFTLKTCSRFAGAVCSIKLGGYEYVDTYDHGREYQTALSVNGLSEGFNPTEAGSRDDGSSNRTSSRLLYANHTDMTLETKTQMAFWLRPNERNIKGISAYNHSSISNFVVYKTITLKPFGIDNAIKYRTEIFIPSNERGRKMLVECLTGYMPKNFSELIRVKQNPIIVIKSKIDNHEYNTPFIIQTPDGNFALGVYAEGLPQKNHPNDGYGIYTYPSVLKWSIVKRVIKPVSNITTTIYLVFGNKISVVNAIKKLIIVNRVKNLLNTSGVF